MAHEDNKPMTEDDIKTMLSAYVSDSVRFDNSTLAKERSDIMKHYDGDLPTPWHKGNSKYVSLDVFDTVEGAKSTILEVLSGNTGIGRFTPQDENDVEPARIATEYTDYVVFRQNQFFKTLQDVTHNGLMARNGIIKAVWATNITEEEEEFEGVTREETYTIAAEDDVQIKSINEDIETGLFFGSILRSTDKSQVDITSVAPEEFIITERASCADSAEFLAHRVQLNKSDLLDMGHDPAKVDKITVSAYGDEHETTPEMLQRFDNDLGNQAVKDAGMLQEAARKFWVYECYAKIDPDGSGRVRLHKITMAGQEILDIEEVSRHPFFFFVPLPKPHSFWGTNFAKKIIATQNAKTVLTRGILDHTVITNNPRYEVLKGTLLNPRELMDNRMGGIVNTNRPGGIAPINQAPLNPFVFQTINLLDADLEDTSGVSKMSQGLNKDAISKQNSAELVGQMTSLSQTRQKVMARNLAENCLKPLFVHVYDLIIENEDKERIAELAGGWVEVDPKTWSSRKDFSIELALGYGEAEKEAQKFFQLDQQLTADPTAQKMYTTEKKFNMLTKAFDALGIRDVANYLTPPDQIPPPQPDPMQKMEMEMRQREMSIREKELEIATENLELKKEEAAAKAIAEQRSLKSKHALNVDQLELAERAQDHKEHVDNEELELAKAAPPESLKTIVSPTG